MTATAGRPQGSGAAPGAAPPAAADPGALRRRHLRFGWWSLLVFVLAGTALELLHGLKVDWYLDAGNETRRLLWRLAHAHGTFLSLVQIAFAFTAGSLARRPRLASPCLLGAGIAIPGGFFLGGLSPHGGDPGIGIVVLPVGVVLLVAAVASTAAALHPRRGADGGAGGDAGPGAAAE